jgi:hypothetical protein
VERQQGGALEQSAEQVLAEQFLQVLLALGVGGEVSERHRFQLGQVLVEPIEHGETPRRGC